MASHSVGVVAATSHGTESSDVFHFEPKRIIICFVFGFQNGQAVKIKHKALAMAFLNPSQNKSIKLCLSKDALKCM